MANFDRNQGNLLIDDNWNLWFIDHTRAFQRTERLHDPEKISMCERNLWRALTKVEDATIRDRLEPFLTDLELEALLMRRVKLVEHINNLVETNGEIAVIIDFDSP